MQTTFKGWVIPAAVGITSFAGGLVAGYFLKDYLDKKNNEEREELESQVTQLAFMFEERDRKNDVTIQQAARVVREFKGEEFLNKFSSSDEPAVVASRQNHPSQNRDNEEAVSSVFRIVDENWNYDVEVPKRNSKTPYIIHRDEFFADEKEYDNQTTLTYYSGDNVLVDENDVPIYDPEKIVGKLEFGKGSGDPNVVYIRNERLEAEYEVLCDTGYYQVEVLGGQLEDSLKRDDLRHSVQKFRME